MAFESLSEVVPRVIQSFLNGVHTATPGKIESYDRTRFRADVTPCVSHFTVKGKEIAIQKIVDVPVVMTGGKAGLLDIELQKGDNVLLIFAESGIGGWKASTGSKQVAPDDLEKHSISDAIAIPCLIPDGVLSKYEEIPRITIDKDKTVKLDNTIGTITIDGTTGQVDINGNLTVDV